LPNNNTKKEQFNTRTPAQMQAGTNGNHAINFATSLRLRGNDYF